MADVTRMPENSFGYVPTPALVAPIEFTLSREDYVALGGHSDHIVTLEEVLRRDRLKLENNRPENPWPSAGKLH